MDHSSTAAKIKQLLTEKLAAEVEITDESWKHAGHAGARAGGGHFFVVVRSAQFGGLGLLARQRLVFAAVGELMQKEIHALSMKCEEL
jgi:BolA protein